MLGKSRRLGKCKRAKSWQAACYESNPGFAIGLANRAGTLPTQFDSVVPSRTPWLSSAISAVKSLSGFIP
jgi:hypothetical protein